MRLLPGERVWWAALGAIVGACAAGGIAYASIPDSNGVIHGCYKTGAGGLRVIDTGAGGECNPSEKSLDWSQAGPTGPAGVAGPTSLSEGGTTVINLSTMLLHTITADEAGLTVAIATVHVFDRDGTAGGPTTVSCNIGGVTGSDASGSGSVATLFDSGESFHRDEQTITAMRRGTVAEGDIVFVSCSSNAGDDDEAAGFAQLLLEHVSR